MTNLKLLVVTLLVLSFVEGGEGYGLRKSRIEENKPKEVKAGKATKASMKKIKTAIKKPKETKGSKGSKGPKGSKAVAALEGNDDPELDDVPAADEDDTPPGGTAENTVEELPADDQDDGSDLTPGGAVQDSDGTEEPLLTRTTTRTQLQEELRTLKTQKSSQVTIKMMDQT